VGERVLVFKQIANLIALNGSVNTISPGCGGGRVRSAASPFRKQLKIQNLKGKTHKPAGGPFAAKNIIYLFESNLKFLKYWKDFE
jgi:hypothetical protein